MNQKVLLGIMIAVEVIGLVLILLGNWIIGTIIAVIGLVLLFIAWRLWMILRISEAISKDDFPRAKSYMAAIKNPDRLNDYSKTYYQFFKGVMDTKENNFKEAEAAFKKALEVNRFRAADEKATAHLMIAQLLLRKRNREGGRRHLIEAKSLTKNAQIQEQIRTIAKQTRLRV